MKHPYPGRISNLIGSVFFGLFVPLLLLPVGVGILNWLGLGPADHPVSLLFGLGSLGGALIFALLAFLSYVQSTEYLLTGPQGIEKHGFGYTYRTGWDNVAGVGLLGRDVLSASPVTEARAQQMKALMEQEVGRQQGARQLFYNLALSASTLTERSGGLGLGAAPEGLVLRLPVTVDRRPWAQYVVGQIHFIDLSDYPNWRHMPLGKEIARYAPEAVQIR